MKKLFFTALLSAFVLGGAFAQFNLSTNARIGQVLKNVNYNDKDTFLVNFNTDYIATPASWAPAKATASLGKDSINWRKAQTQKGLQMKGFVNATTTTEYKFGTSDCNNYGGNRNPVYVYSVDSLKKIMNKSIVSGTFATINGNTSDSLSRPATCLFNVGAGDAAFGMYPGKVKRVEYGFYINLAGKQVIDDITMDINTLDAGNSGKTATYSLRVYKSSTFTPANMIGDSVMNFYTTGSGMTTKSLATAIGVTPAAFSNKPVYIIIKTMGTENASAVVDGLPNAVDANNVPLVTDPIIVFDNLTFVYQVALWKAPVLAAAASTVNTYLDHSNGTITTGTSSDYTGGTTVPVAALANVPVKFYLTSVGRVQNMNIKESNDGSAHQAAFSFAATGAVKAKDATGAFTIDVPYIIKTENATTLTYSLDIAAPVSGIANDTLEVSLLANVADATTKSVRFEITNGTRFWYDITATGSIATGLKTNKSDVKLISSNNKIYVSSATDNVDIISISGQRIKSVSATEAVNGIAVQSGLYIVKSGSFVQKVLVK